MSKSDNTKVSIQAKTKKAYKAVSRANKLLRIPKLIRLLQPT